MQLIFEHTQEISNEAIFGAAHFPDNYFRVFFLSEDGKIMMQKTETPYGNFVDRVFSNPSVAFERARVTDCRVYYMPQAFLFALALIKNIPTLLYYDVGLEMFVDVLEVMGKILNFRSEPLKAAIALYWDNPSAEHLFDKVQIRRKLENYPEDIEDGTEIYTGRANEYKDLNLIMGQQYFYRAFPSDISGEVVDDREGQELEDSPLDLLTALYIVHSNSVILENIRTI